MVLERSEIIEGSSHPLLPNSKKHLFTTTSLQLLKKAPLVLGLVLLAASARAADEAPLSGNSQACLECHSSVHPGLAADWRSSRHARVTPAQALQKPEQERRISSANIPAALKEQAVGCYECHSLNADRHQDNFEHFGYQINVVVSPADCAVCHQTEADQFADSKKAHAHGNLADNPLFHSLVDEVLGVETLRNGAFREQAPLQATEANACFGCHGTEITVQGLKTVETFMGEIEIPDLAGWPNQGIGRVNPDGSLGSCAACHPRHSFAIEIARQPHTCSQCHLDPDVPAYPVYRESKHGNIFQSEGHSWDLQAVPWTPGKDFKAPTCAVCHNSLLVDPQGEVLAERTHDFGARLWVRIFGLIYSHPQPQSGDTTVIRNQAGQALPTTFENEPASRFLISEEEQQSRRQQMHLLCTSCHSTAWADGFFTRMDEELAATDAMVRTTTQVLQKAWQQGLAEKTDPFDEALEKMWVRNWLFYANSARYAAAMAGPDYASFKNGWWSLSETLQKMQESVRMNSAPPPKEKDTREDGQAHE